MDRLQKTRILIVFTSSIPNINKNNQLPDESTYYCIVYVNQNIISIIFFSPHSISLLISNFP